MMKLFSFPTSEVQKHVLNEHSSNTSGAPDTNKNIERWTWPYMK